MEPSDFDGIPQSRPGGCESLAGRHVIRYNHWGRWHARIAGNDPAREERKGENVMNHRNRFVVLCVLLAVLSICVSRRGNAAAIPAIAQDAPAESSIRAVLETQVAAWNRGDIESFMNGYWNSADTEFVGAAGVTRGWQSVLDRYRKNYPDHKAMGQLAFSKLEVHILCPDAAYVTGEFHLERANDKPEGVFTLVFRKLDRKSTRLNSSHH